MSSAYSRLCALLPDRDPQPSTRFPQDSRRVSAWVDTLPRANQQLVIRQVAEALESLNAQRCDALQRLALMELLRPVVLECVAGLRQQLTGGSFPLTNAQNTAAMQVHGLHQQLAQGYLRAAVDMCAPDGNVPFLRGQKVATALQRTIHHTARRLFLGYWLYLSPVKNAWRELHALFTFAVDRKLEDKAVSDSQIAAGSSVLHSYAASVLLAVSNPYRFNQRDQDKLYDVCSDLARHCQFMDEEGEGDRFGVAIDGDFVPNQPLPAAEDGDQPLAMRWFDLTTIAGSIDRSIGKAREGDVMVRPDRGRSVVVPADLLRRLRASWVPAAARGYRRLQAEHRLDTVVGLSGLHFQLTEGQSFDGFMQSISGARLGSGNQRAAWAHAGSEHAEVVIGSADVLDQSLGGYRLRWGPEQRVRAKVGELVGLSVSDNVHPDWMIAVVRWLRYEPDGGVHAGIELLARRGYPLGVRVLDRSGLSRAAQRGIRLQPLQHVANGDWRLLVPAMIDPHARLEVIHPGNPDEEDQLTPSLSHMQASAVLETAGEYLLLAVEPIGAEALS